MPAPSTCLLPATLLRIAILLLCATAGVLPPLIVAVVVLLASALLVPTLLLSAALLVLAAVLSIASMATLLLPGSLTVTPLVALGSVGAAGGALFVLCSALVPALDLATLVFTLLGLMILRLRLVVEPGSLRRSCVRRCVGVHECRVEGVRVARIGTMRPVNTTHACRERMLHASAGTDAIADVTDQQPTGYEFE